MEGGKGCSGAWVTGTPIPLQANQQPPPYFPPSGPGHMNHPYGAAPSREAYPFAPASAAAAQGPNPYVPAGAHGANPYVQRPPASHPSATASVEMVVKVLGRCGKKLEKGAKNAGSATDHLWQHLRTAPNLKDAAMSSLAMGTKVFAEGGRDKLFEQTFGILPGELLRKAYACYLSTPSGPAIGTLYLSTRRLAFCSGHGPSASPGQPPLAHHKVVLELSQVLAVVPCPSRMNPSDKYIQVLTTAGHELWFMGFVSYEKAVKNMTEALQQRPPATAGSGISPTTI